MKKISANGGERQPLSAFSKVILIAEGIVLLVGAVLSLMMRGGLVLAKPKVYAWIPIIAVAILLAWGIYGISRKMREGRLRIIVICTLGFVVLMLISMCATILNYTYSFVSSKFVDVRSADGCRLTIMRRYEYDEERVKSRRTGEEDAALQEWDYSYYYTAYPRKLLFFVDGNADAEGGVVIGVDSQARLMIEWIDGHTAHLYIDSPEEFDSGEITVRFPQ